MDLTCPFSKIAGGSRTDLNAKGSYVIYLSPSPPDAASLPLPFHPGKLAQPSNQSQAGHLWHLMMLSSQAGNCSTAPNKIAFASHCHMKGPEMMT